MLLFFIPFIPKGQDAFVLCFCLRRFVQATTKFTFDDTRKVLTEEHPTDAHISPAVIRAVKTYGKLENIETTNIAQMIF